MNKIFLYIHRTLKKYVCVTKPILFYWSILVELWYICAKRNICRQDSTDEKSWTDTFWHRKTGKRSPREHHRQPSSLLKVSKILCYRHHQIFIRYIVEENQNIWQKVKDKWSIGDDVEFLTASNANKVNKDVNDSVVLFYSGPQWSWDTCLPYCDTHGYPSEFDPASTSS